MVTYLPYILCAILMLFSIKGSIQGALEEGSAKYSLNRLIYYFSIFITFLIMLTNLDKIYLAILIYEENIRKIESDNNK